MLSRITATALATCLLIGHTWGWQTPVPLVVSSSSWGRQAAAATTQGRRPSQAAPTAPGMVLYSNRPGAGYGPPPPPRNDPAFYDEQQYYGNGNYENGYYQEMGDRFDYRQQQRNYNNRAFNGRDLNRDQIGSASHWSNSRNPNNSNNPRSSGDHQTMGPDARWNTADRRDRADSFWNGRGRQQPGMMPPPGGYDNGRLPQWGDRRGRGGRSSTFWPNNNNRSNNSNRRSSGFNSDNHETMGPAPEWDSAARRARASSFWDGGDRGGNRSYRYQNGRGGGGGFMGGGGGGPYERRNNMWRPQTNFYQPEYETSMGYFDDLGRGLQNFNQRGWNPRSRRSDYETGITGPPSSEQFQKGINQQQTMGPKPASEYRRRLERERLKSGANYYPQQRNYYDQREDFPPYYDDFPERYPEQWGGDMYR